MGVGGQPQVPVASTPRKDLVPIVQETVWVPGPVWSGAENLVPTGIRIRTVQPVVSHYNDSATRYIEASTVMSIFRNLYFEYMT